jgi:hypothetical protein
MADGKSCAFFLCMLLSSFSMRRSACSWSPERVMMTGMVVVSRLTPRRRTMPRLYCTRSLEARLFTVTAAWRVDTPRPLHQMSRQERGDWPTSDGPTVFPFLSPADPGRAAHHTYYQIQGKQVVSHWQCYALRRSSARRLEPSILSLSTVLHVITE